MKTIDDPYSMSFICGYVGMTVRAEAIPPTHMEEGERGKITLPEEVVISWGAPTTHTA